MLCPKCGKITEHDHVHNEAYGIAGTHMAGSERYECRECGHALYAEEGSLQGLDYVLDKQVTAKQN
jgi:DNA-directed RNA polymerase subunit RPC12/RpoP